MSRKATGHWPIVEFSMAPKKGWGSVGEFTEEGAHKALREALEDVRAMLPRTLGRDYVLDIGGHVQSDYVCEHCGYRWTEKSTTYNGGCCDKDEEANPEREKAA